MDNIFKNCSGVPAKGTENFETIFKNDKIEIEKILSNELIEGEWYEQNNDEWVILLCGNAVLEFENHTQELECGDYLYIPKLKKHRVLKTSDDAMWLALHLNPHRYNTPNKDTKEF
ncbi:MAG: cupin domain-containing protein [Campylobacterales bacterium]|nr:cupin domain-containing protein [Campylobacterales bacterium]